ncbi:unnamed protein product [[Actinomadura] parvosata subsp. kistnae]|nr:unnamed protein product [Actinomadura parvosata subsp. kistnae]
MTRRGSRYPLRHPRHRPPALAPQPDIEHPNPAITNRDATRSDLIGDLDQGYFETSPAS